MTTTMGVVLGSAIILSTLQVYAMQERGAQGYSLNSPIVDESALFPNEEESTESRRLSTPAARLPIFEGVSSEDRYSPQSQEYSLLHAAGVPLPGNIERPNPSTPNLAMSCMQSLQLSEAMDRNPTFEGFGNRIQKLLSEISENPVRLGKQEGQGVYFEIILLENVCVRFELMWSTQKRKREVSELSEGMGCFRVDGKRKTFVWTLVQESGRNRDASTMRTTGIVFEDLIDGIFFYVGEYSPPQVRAVRILHNDPMRTLHNDPINAM